MPRASGAGLLRRLRDDTLVPPEAPRPGIRRRGADLSLPAPGSLSASGRAGADAASAACLAPLARPRSRAASCARLCGSRVPVSPFQRAGRCVPHPGVGDEFRGRGQRDALVWRAPEVNDLCGSGGLGAAGASSKGRGGGSSSRGPSGVRHGIRPGGRVEGGPAPVGRGRAVGATSEGPAQPSSGVRVAGAGAAGLGVQDFRPSGASREARRGRPPPARAAEAAASGPVTTWDGALGGSAAGTESTGAFAASRGKPS